MILVPCFALMIPAMAIAQSQPADPGEQSGLFVGPLPLAAIYPVHVDQPVQILARGQEQPFTDMWLLVSAPSALPKPVANAEPAKPRVDIPPVIPILHVNEYRAKLVHLDQEKGVLGWLVPKVELESALVWQALMVEDFAFVWEGPFWQNNPTLEQIAESATLIAPVGQEHRPKRPTYTKEEIENAKGKDRPTLGSLEQAIQTVKQAAAAAPSKSADPVGNATRLP